MSNVAIFDSILPKVEHSAFDVFSHSSFDLLDPFVRQVEE